MTEPAPIDVVLLGRMPYDEALERQFDLVARRRAGEVPDTLLLLEHDPVYTIGRTRDRSSLRDPDGLPHPAVEIGRGGQATFHGPGQLVGYPILDLTSFGRDLHAYLRVLEDALIDFLTDHGVPAARSVGRTGVWVEDRKIASIGVGVRHWITLHGFALNVTRESLPPFEAIVPCGLPGVRMTCLEDELPPDTPVPTLAEAGRGVARHLAAQLGTLRPPAG